MNKEKIYLGRVKKIPPEKNYRIPKDIFILGERLAFEKHSWDCDWYWGFGYIGNANLHTHAEVFTKDLLWHSVDDVFEDHIFDSDDSFWVFKDLLVQAYALSKASHVYKSGGYCTTRKGVTDVIIDKAMETRVNKDLEKVLNTLWEFLLEQSEKKKTLASETKRRDSNVV